ncbi:heat shock protein 30 [Irpex rosettiformis]|uniref:Heat shock protein 30 n=1 Tax=Irpex rosettiformis TaxID=378272 RepID=A0ACB8UI34_9APHY|nr:heat shock protein 30 [Irpex rosettiformis]
MAGSLDQNPPNAERHITAGGTDWLWTVFAIMTVSTLGMMIWSFERTRGSRFFHNISIVILTTASIAYFTMASDLGATPITPEFRNTGTRQIFYVRYIQWFINFPLLLVLILYATGIALSDVLTTAFFAWVVVVTGLVGALTHSSYKWGYFTLGVVSLFYIWYVFILLLHGPRSSFASGSGVRSDFIRGASFVVLITMLYPVCWGVSEGGNVISPNREMVFYGILDLLLGPVFLFYFVWGLSNVDYGLFKFNSCRPTDAPYGYGVESATGGKSRRAGDEDGGIVPNLPGTHNTAAPSAGADATGVSTGVASSGAVPTTTKAEHTSVA